MLAFGCPRVLTKLDASGCGRLVERANLRHAKAADGRTPLFSPWPEWDGPGGMGGRFLELCILAGCDYLESLKGVGIQTAHRELRRLKSAATFVELLSKEGKLTFEAGAEGYLHYFAKAKETFLHQR